MLLAAATTSRGIVLPPEPPPPAASLFPSSSSSSASSASTIFSLSNLMSSDEAGMHSKAWQARLHALPLFSTLLPSLGPSLDPGFEYELVIGYDVGDPVYDVFDDNDEVEVDRSSDRRGFGSVGGRRERD